MRDTEQAKLTSIRCSPDAPGAACDWLRALGDLTAAWVR